MVVSVIAVDNGITTYNWPWEGCGTRSYDGTALLVGGLSTAALTIDNPAGQLSYYSACTFTASATKGECVYDASSGPLSTKTTRTMASKDFSTQNLVITAGQEKLSSTSGGSTQTADGPGSASTGAGPSFDSPGLLGVVVKVVIAIAAVLRK